MNRIALPDLASMAAFGAAIARELRAGDVIALSGGLGAGKTTLARAIIHALGHEGEVPSPSFAIIEVYDPPGVRLPVVHADFYRLERPQDADELGLDDYRDGAALIAEWPENAGGFAQEPACLAIMLQAPDYGGGDTAGEKTGPARIAIVEAGDDWLGRTPCP